MSNMSKKKIAITGTIGSGKSTVTQLISKNFPTISSDDIVANLYKEESFVECINKEILKIDSKILDKQEIAKAIFSDVNLKDKIESIIHPLVKERIDEFFNEQKGCIFVEVPLLFEANFDSLFDDIILVISDEELILDRLVSYRGYSEADAKSRIRNQYSIEKKQEKSDFIITNNESLDVLNYKVDELLRKLECEC